MDIIRFVKSFLNIDTYLFLAMALLTFLIVYFYMIAPYD